MEIKLIKAPTEDDWIAVKRRALITMYGKGLKESYQEPDSVWKESILQARHSPIRYLLFSFLMIDIPGNVMTHLVRHVHAQPYVSSLRNDRQSMIDGDLAPRSTPVNGIFDVNAEELIVIANKRLCKKAAQKTREVVERMCNLASQAVPEIASSCVPMCIYHGGVCHEILGCGLCPSWRKVEKGKE